MLKEHAGTNSLMPRASLILIAIFPPILVPEADKFARRVRPSSESSNFWFVWVMRYLLRIVEEVWMRVTTG